MTTEGTILTAEFPRAVRGYSPIAVDDFIRQLGERLDAMQTKLNEQTARANGLQNMVTRANKDLAAYVEKESAISKGIITIEERRVTVEREIELSRQNAALEVEELRSGAEAQAQELLTHAQTQAHDVISGAQLEAQELRSRAQSDAHDLLKSANDSADEILANAQQLADETLQSAHNEAAEVVSHAKAAAEAQAEMVRQLCAEYEQTAGRVRRALENQLATLPSPGSMLETLSVHGIVISNGVESGSRELTRAA